MRSWKIGLLVLAVVGIASTTGVATAAGRTDNAMPMPAGTTAGFIAYDRVAGKVTAQHLAHHRFRSASLVKILIALDYLATRAPDAGIPADDRPLLESMLRSSNDDAANVFWGRGGGPAIVSRMITRIGLTESAPPPPGYPGWWGYTALTASDVVKIYQYVLSTAPAPVRGFVMGNLRQSTRCATDGRDQHFGIPRAVAGPWAVKQGWSRFPDPVPPAERCTPAAAQTTSPHGPADVGMDAPNPPVSVRVAGGDLDLTRRAMHTSGTIGAGDRTILVVLTLEGLDTPWNESAARITRLAAAVYRAGRT